MRRNFLPYCICVFLTGFAFSANAEKVSAAYKLGEAYTSEINDKVKCLEGHAGAIIGNAGCKDFSRGCKNDSDCSGFGTLASASSDGSGYKCSSTTKQCEYQECGSTSVCVKKYSHMRSCVKNARGVKECRITCNWQKIIEAGQGIFGSVNIAKRMQFEYALWKSPANINLSTYAQFLTDKSVTASDNWYTWKNGAISKCYGYGLQKDYSGEWSNMNNPCLPCSIASGGTWGIGNEESPSKLGKYPYSAAAWSADLGLDLSQQYTGSGGAFWVTLYDQRCANETALKGTSSYISRLNNSFPLMTRLGESDDDKVKLSRVNVRAVQLGTSGMCVVWHRRNAGENSRYVSGNVKGFTCAKDGIKLCIQTTDLAELVFVPQQNVSRQLYTASGGASRLVTVNFNRSGGTLLCCRSAAEDNSDVDVRNGIIKNCVSISPMI